MKKKNQKYENKMTNKKANTICNSAKNANKKNQTDAKLNQNICDECCNNFESNELE